MLVTANRYIIPFFYLIKFDLCPVWRFCRFQSPRISVQTEFPHIIHQMLQFRLFSSDQSGELVGGHKIF